MATKRHKPEEIVTRLRQVEVLVGQGMSRIDAIREIGGAARGGEGALRPYRPLPHPDEQEGHCGGLHRAPRGITRTSAFGLKADINHNAVARPLIANTGHSYEQVTMMNSLPSGGVFLGRIRTIRHSFQERDTMRMQGRA